MPRVEVTTTVPICVGEHTLKLDSIEEKQFENTFQPKNAQGEHPVRNTWVWKFISNQEDDDGEPYVYGVITNTAYGNARAGLTLLLDMLVPGMTESKARNFDTDTLIGKKFKALITLKTAQDGTKKPTHSYLTPLAKTQAKPVVEEEEEEVVEVTPSVAETKRSRAKVKEVDPFED